MVKTAKVGKIVGPPLPSKVTLLDVSPGDDAFGQAGDYAPADATVTAKIVGDDFGLFDIAEILIFDVQKNPDAPGAPPVLVPAGSVEGPGPVSVVGGEAVLVKVRFRAPLQPPQDTFTATAVIAGDNWSMEFSISVQASIGGISVQFQPRILNIVQGGRATAQLQVRSLGGPPTDVSFFMVAAPQGISLDGGGLTVPVGSHETATRTVTFVAQLDAEPGTHELQGLRFSAFNGTLQGSLDHLLKFNVLLQDPVDDSISWQQAGQFAIATDKARNAWVSGHINAIVPLGNEAVLIGSDTGGVWSIASTGAAIPLSDDWDNPDVTCMGVGPDSPNHFYAGCKREEVGSLFETEPRALFMTWNEVPLVDADDATIDTGGILSMAVLRSQRKIVLGCVKGVIWSSIPAPGGGRIRLLTGSVPAGNALQRSRSRAEWHSNYCNEWLQSAWYLPRLLGFWGVNI